MTSSIGTSYYFIPAFAQPIFLLWPVGNQWSNYGKQTDALLPGADSKGAGARFQGCVYETVSYCSQFACYILYFNEKKYFSDILKNVVVYS